ncbi:DNA-directed RNA polymerase subunit alpha C-terminal domain-containing protein [Streptosporangium sandarakinum]
MPAVHLSLDTWKTILAIFDGLAQVNAADSGEAHRIHALISNQLNGSATTLDIALADLIDRTGLPLDTPIQDALESMTNIRAVNCLRRESIATLGDLRRCTYDDLLDIRNVGPRSLVELRQCLWAYVVD